MEQNFNTPPAPAPPVPAKRNTAVIVLTVILIGSGLLNILLFIVFVGMSFMLGGGAGMDGYTESIIDGEITASERILLLRVNGVIMRGANGPDMVQSIRKRLDIAARDDYKGVLLVINSPGGGVSESDELYHILKTFRDTNNIPIVAYFENLAASGGYYIAVAADTIIAQPTSITGSIGVIMSLMNVTDLMDKAGVASNVIISDRTPFKDIGSPFREMTETEQKRLTGIVDEMYQRFVDVVNEGRGALTAEQVGALANGMIYTGTAALEKGLIDEVGYFDDALARIRTAAGSSHAAVIELKSGRGLLGEILYGASIPEMPLLMPFKELMENAQGGPMYLWMPGAGH